MVRKLLEKAIEIEGLLRIIRDGNPCPETFILLRSKAGELADAAMTLEEQSAAIAPQPEPKEISEEPEENMEQEQLQPLERPHEIDMSSELTNTNEEEKKPQDEYGTTDEEIETKIPDVEITMSAAQDSSFSVAYKNTEETTDDAEDDILFTFEEDITDEEAASANETELNSPKEPEPIVEIKKEETQKKGQSESGSFRRHVKLKSAFSLNDRFLYSRELFDGNMKMFDSTLDFIEGIEDYAIIEDYFYNELEWDPENPSVGSFMEILRPQFKE